ncbi:hypothetical protein NF865_07890 [Thermococcus aggregans]|uniref:Uncharacterized protein n=1 Tax=Thermococcus aggregans TaxID=110163 RepID=A0A9E7SNW9_THEAG|nr:hypothetical protein [Thermococcus aggregans]USS40242.1 hypothetical protein NF865_07890 [Thermococcus aggregans]
MVLSAVLFGFAWVKLGVITREWVLSTILLFALMVASMVFFLARILEKHGYRKSDIKRIDEILEEHWKEPWDSGYLKYDVQECIAHHLILWGIFSTFLLGFHDVFLAIMAFVGLAFLMVVMYPVFATMAVWIVALPLYFLKSRRAEYVFEGIGKTSLAITLAIPVIWVVSSYVSTKNYPEDVLRMFNAVIRNAEKFLALSLLNTLFGFLGVYLPRRIGKRLLTLVLLSIAVAMIFVVWSIFQPLNSAWGV